MLSSLEKFIGSSLLQKKRIAWFGLSADPPTLAHRMIVDAVLGSGLVDLVVVFPAGKLQYKDFEATDWQRLDMIELWRSSAEFSPQEVIVSSFDIKREKAYTWHDLYNTLSQFGGSYRHYFVVGSDQYKEIPKSWNNGEELLEEASFIVIPRDSTKTSLQYGHHYLLDVEPLPVSSTNIRKGSLEGIDEKVANYIKKEHLYSHI